MINYETFKLNSPKQWRKLVISARQTMELQCINGVVNLNDCLCSLLGEYRAIKACSLLSDCCRQDELARQVSVMSKLQSLPLQFKISDCKYKREHVELVFSSNLNQIRKQDDAPRAGADSSLRFNRICEVFGCVNTTPSHDDAFCNEPTCTRKIHLPESEC